MQILSFFSFEFSFSYFFALTTASYSISSENSGETEDKGPKETVIDDVVPKVKNVNEFVAEKDAEAEADRYLLYNKNTNYLHLEKYLLVLLNHVKLVYR